MPDNNPKARSSRRSRRQREKIDNHDQQSPVHYGSFINQYRLSKSTARR